MDLSAVENLKIKDVFIGAGIDEILDSITKTEDYIGVLFDVTTHQTIWVTDDAEEGHCVFVSETAGMNKDKLLNVINHHAKTLFLWRIDGVMFPNQMKCDCALLREQFLHFVEFKTNATTTNPESIHEHYEKAQTQLKMTFDKFKELYQNKGIDIFDLLPDIDARIVFDKTIPQDSAYQKNLQARFLNENEIKLSFGNDIVFE